MDRSFLSRPEVIAASRKFVCVRLATYEDKEEGNFLKAFDVTRSGDLENTAFTLLSPDGKRHLARAARSARQTFGTAARMAERMNAVAAAYGATKPARVTPALPAVANVRLAVNVAASDNLPLVLVFSPDARVRTDLEARVAALAWSERFIGHFTYVVAPAPRELSPVSGVKAEPGLFVVQPDRFGQKGTVLAKVGADAPRDRLEKCLADGLARHRPQEESFREHVRDGHRKGVFWETVLPVTDPMERQARERGRRHGREGAGR